MGEKYRVHLRCPQCARLGIVLVDDGPPFTVERLPSYFSVVTKASTHEGTKMGCQCGEIFELPKPTNRRDGSGGALHT
jgi:hypothetical protein